MDPFMNQDMGNRVDHRLPPLFLIQTQRCLAEHLSEAFAIDEYKRLDLSRDPLHPAKRVATGSTPRTIRLREHTSQRPNSLTSITLAA
jgi:hypothetical protein